MAHGTLWSARLPRATRNEPGSPEEAAMCAAGGRSEARLGAGPGPSSRRMSGSLAVETKGPGGQKGGSRLGGVGTRAGEGSRDGGGVGGTDGA